MEELPKRRRITLTKKILTMVCLGTFMGVIGLPTLGVSSSVSANNGGHHYRHYNHNHHYHNHGYIGVGFYDPFWSDGWGDPFWDGIGFYAPTVVRTRTVVAVPGMSVVESENYYKNNVLALVKNAGLWGLVDTNGKIILSPSYKCLIPVGQGAFYAGNSINELSKIDQFGHALPVGSKETTTESQIKPVDSVNTITNANTNTNTNINANTNTNTNANANANAIPKSNTNPVMWMKDKNGHYVLVNSEGQVIKADRPQVDKSKYSSPKEAAKAQEQVDLASDVPVKITAIKGFKHGVSPAKQNGKWGIVNAEGKWLVRPIYEAVELI